MGAASNYGKTTDIGINSPTHRNTHDEEVFSPNNNTSTSAAIKKNDLLEDLFSDAAAAPQDKSSNVLDDFNPRSDETQEFGDFNSAFGSNTVTSQPPKPPSLSGDDEFADFSSAFSSGGGGANINQPPKPAVTSNNDFLFESIPSSINLNNSTAAASSNIDLFGGNLNVLQAAVTLNSSTTATDLLSDFGGLTLDAPVSNGELKFLFVNKSVASCYY